MEQDFDLKHWENKKCPKYDCKKESCKCGLKKVFLAAALGDDKKGSPIAPKNGAYCNALVVYEANDHVYLYSTEGIPTLMNVEAGGSEEAIAELEEKLSKEISNRKSADDVLQGEIDAIKNSPDVVDIVATYAALQAYDTSSLGNNDIIRVLVDETHDGQSTYYRWNATASTWTYIGAVGDYYTKGQVDTLLGGKQNTLTAGSNISISGNTISATDTKYTAGTNVNISAQNVISATDTTYSDFTGATTQQAGTSGLVPAPTTSDPDKYLKGDGSWDTPTDTTYTAGTNVQISSGNVISATDTTYSNFTGTDGVDPGTAGLVPAPATTDAGKFLKADGTWDTVNAGPTVVQTTGTSTTDVMSQDATTKLIYPDIANSPYKQVIGEGLIDGTNQGLVINGVLNPGNNGGSIAIGVPNGSRAQIGQNGRADHSVAIGNSAVVGRGSQSVAIGYYAYTNSGQNSGDNVALGYNTYAGMGSATSTVALGAYAQASRTGEVNIGTGSNGTGYNNTNYRVLGGVHDGQSAHDAATVGQLNGRVLQNAGAPTTATVGTVGQLLEDTTNGKLYQCTAIDTTDPNNPSYTWSEVGAGGGGGAEFIELTTADYNWNSSTGQTGTPNCVALWLLPSGIYKGPADSNIDVRATKSQDYSMGAGFSSYAIVKECENTNNNRAIVTYVDGGTGNIVEYYSIDENGQNYSIKNFPNVVQTTGTSTTNVMSQNATTSMVYADPGTNTKIKIGGSQSSVGRNSIVVGASSSAVGNESVTIGYNASANGVDGIAIGEQSGAYNQNSVTIGIQSVVRSNSGVALGDNAKVATSSNGAVAIGAYSSSTQPGEMNIGSTNTSYGYNSTNYRLLSGVHDGQSAHDAATLGQLNSRIIGSLTSAPTTSTVGSVGSLLATVESGTGHLYICTDDTGGVYTWQTLV